MSIATEIQMLPFPANADYYLDHKASLTQQDQQTIEQYLLHEAQDLGFDESDEAVLKLTGRCTTCGHELPQCTCGSTPSTNATTKSANV